MNVNTDFSIYGVKLTNTPNHDENIVNIKNITKKEKKEIINNNKYPIIIINPTFEETNIVDHVSIGLR